MPPLPNVANVIRVTLKIAPGATPLVQSRFFIKYTGTAPLNADLGTFNTAVSTAFGTNLKSLLDTGSVLEEVDSEDLTSNTAAVAATVVSVSGTRAGGEIPAEAAAVTSYAIARRYRGGHPRGYWPFGVTTDLASRRVWTGPFISAVNTGMAAFMTAVKAAGWTGAGVLSQVNVSYYQGFTVVTNPITHRARNVPSLRAVPVVDTVNSIVCQGRVGSQRRRDSS